MQIAITIIMIIIHKNGKFTAIIVINNGAKITIKIEYKIDFKIFFIWKPAFFYGASHK